MRGGPWSDPGARKAHDAEPTAAERDDLRALMDAAASATVPASLSTSDDPADQAIALILAVRGKAKTLAPWQADTWLSMCNEQLLRLRAAITASDDPAELCQDHERRRAIRLQNEGETGTALRLRVQPIDDESA